MTFIGSVLIIDDEANLRNTLSRILHKAGCQVTTAGEGSEAIQLLRNNVFDLIFLDLRLPDIHGIEMLRMIRQIHSQLPVVVLTGHGSINSAVEAMHLEATDYLLKPIDPEILVSRTRKILEQEKRKRRKLELQNQIDQLQAELRDLETSLNQVPSPDILPTLLADSRYVKLGPFTLDLQTRRVLDGNNIIEIPPSSFDYLAVLARYAPKVVSYQNLVRESQGYDADLSEARNLTRWHIHVLRQAIELDPKSPKYLLNLRGEGYQLVID